jgi:PleD family two-component response regulator
MILAKELEARIRALQIPHEASTAASFITVSIGLATQTVDSIGDAQALVHLADDQLYQSKQDGRARVSGKPL